MKTEKTDYQGWTNYETWNCALWINNEQGSQNYWHETTKEILKKSKKDKYFTKEESATNQIAKILKNEMEENNPLNDKASMYSDILNAAISEINFYEIAKSFIDDIKE